MLNNEYFCKAINKGGVYFVPKGVKHLINPKRLLTVYFL